MLGLNTPAAEAEVAPREFSIGGIMSARPASAILEDERRAAQKSQARSPVVSSLSAQLSKHWEQAKMAKREVEQQMIQALRAKRGEYHPTVLQEIRQQGGSEIYMMLFASKARQFKALVGDIMLGTGEDKPWVIHPTPDPEMPEDIKRQILAGAMQIAMQAEQGPVPMSVEDIRALLSEAKDHARAEMVAEAKARCARAETKMEDMLLEGGFIEALDQFLDDLSVFKNAFIKGPVVRKTPELAWQAQPDGTSTPAATYKNKPHWERVDPLMVYPSSWNRSVHDGYLFERHRLAPAALSDLIGQEGYDDAAIRRVLDTYEAGGLHEWLAIDTERASAEGNTTVNQMMGSDLIDALQYWGQVSGKMLVGWGMDKAQVPDMAKVYDVEIWQIGTEVIKCVLNDDPMARRPYYTRSFESVAGAFWGNSLYDVMRDCEDMCNAMARALSNNVGMASGPQVWVNVDRLPVGEDITTLYPWKIHQLTSDPNGTTAAPMGFFQPQSNASELMGVFERFSQLADEVTGIPKYLTGDGSAGGAGRTASGMSMMIGNASKTTRNSVWSIDLHVMTPLLNDLYAYIMRYVGDPDIKGDLRIQARGALALTTKESAQVRRTQFLQTTANPIDMQIIGMEGRAALLREAAKTLDMNADDVVPPPAILKLKAAQAQAVQDQQNQQLAAEQANAQMAQTSQKPGERRLMNQAPATSDFG